MVINNFRIWLVRFGRIASLQIPDRKMKNTVDPGKSERRTTYAGDAQAKHHRQGGMKKDICGKRG